MDSAELALSTSLYELGKRQAAIANNLANINATAFKRRVGTFTGFELELDAAVRDGINTTTIPRYTEQSDRTQGDFSRTDNMYNIALVGDGYMRVKGPNNEDLFTRDGALALGSDGTLMTHHGHPVLDEQGGRIQLNETGTIKISTQGTIIDEATGEARGKIGLWSFDDPAVLVPRGSALFAGPSGPAGLGGPSQAKVDLTTQIRQGGLERSNVNSVSELVAMITVQRHHGAVAKALSTVESIHDQLLGLARS